MMPKEEDYRPLGSRAAQFPNPQPWTDWDYDQDHGGWVDAPGTRGDYSSTHTRPDTYVPMSESQIGDHRRRFGENRDYWQGQAQNIIESYVPGGSREDIVETLTSLYRSLPNNIPAARELEDALRMGNYSETIEEAWANATGERFLPEDGPMMGDYYNDRFSPNPEDHINRYANGGGVRRNSLMDMLSRGRR